MEYGTKLVGKTQYIPRSALTDSVIGSVYELKIETHGVPDPTATIDLLRSELPKSFSGLKVLWVRIEGSTIQMQISGSPFAWSALLVLLPSILVLVGIIVSLIAVFLVFAQVPGWIIGMFLVGVALIIGGPAIGKALTSGIPDYRGK